MFPGDGLGDGEGEGEGEGDGEGDGEGEGVAEGLGVGEVLGVGVSLGVGVGVGVGVGDDVVAAASEKLSVFSVPFLSMTWKIVKVLALAGVVYEKLACLHAVLAATVPSQM